MVGLTLLERVLRRLGIFRYRGSEVPQRQLLQTGRIERGEPFFHAIRTLKSIRLWNV